MTITTREIARRLVAAAAKKGKFGTASEMHGMISAFAEPVHGRIGTKLSFRVYWYVDGAKVTEAEAGVALAAFVAKVENELYAMGMAR